MFSLHSSYGKTVMIRTICEAVIAIVTLYKLFEPQAVYQPSFMQQHGVSVCLITIVILLVFIVYLVGSKK